MDKEADVDDYGWELSEGPPCPPMEQAADLFNEDWDLELKADQGNPYGRSGVPGSCWWLSQSCSYPARCHLKADGLEVDHSMSSASPLFQVWNFCFFKIKNKSQLHSVLIRLKKHSKASELSICRWRAQLSVCFRFREP